MYFENSYLTLLATASNISVFDRVSFLLTTSKKSSQTVVMKLQSRSVWIHNGSRFMSIDFGTFSSKSVFSVPISYYSPSESVNSTVSSLKIAGDYHAVIFHLKFIPTVVFITPPHSNADA